MTKAESKRNIKVLAFTCLLTESYFVISIWMLFYLQYIDFTQVAVLTALRVLISNVLEIPTGAFADIVGKKKTITIAYIVYALGLAFIVFAPKIFAFFLIWEIFRGISKALWSGSYEAIIFDSLKDVGEEKEYDSVYSKLQAFEWIGLFIGAFGGGFLYDQWDLLPYIIVMILYILSGILHVIYIVEPDSDTDVFSLKGYFTQLVKGFKELFPNRHIGIRVLTLATISFVYFIAASILGISQGEQYGMDGTQIGFMFGIGYVLSALLSYVYPKIKEKVSSNIIELIIVVLLFGSFIFAKYVGVWLGALLIIGRILSSTTFFNIKSKFLNQNISSKNRATALSTFNMLFQIPYALLAYFIGNYIDRTSANDFANQTGLVLLGISIILYAVYFYLARRNTSAKVRPALSHT